MSRSCDKPKFFLRIVIVTTIGLFSVTEPEFYGVYGGNNISIDTNIKDTDYIISTILERI